MSESKEKNGEVEEVLIGYFNFYIFNVRKYLFINYVNYYYFLKYQKFKILLRVLYVIYFYFNIN